MRQKPTLEQLLDQQGMMIHKQSLKDLEQSFLSAICRELEDRIIKTRLSYLLDWYTRKAQRNKFWYNWCRFISYLVPCLITLVSVYGSVFDADHSKWAILTTATLSAFLVALHHVIDHYRFYENWVRYRDTAEKLKTETELFLNHCEPYNKKDKQKNQLNFAAKIEFYSSSELAGWENLLDESYRPFREQTQAALQNSSQQTIGLTSLNVLEDEALVSSEAADLAETVRMTEATAALDAPEPELPVE